MIYKNWLYKKILTLREKKWLYEEKITLKKNTPIFADFWHVFFEKSAHQSKNSRDICLITFDDLQHTRVSGDLGTIKPDLRHSSDFARFFTPRHPDRDVPDSWIKNSTDFSVKKFHPQKNPIFSDFWHIF